MSDLDITLARAEYLDFLTDAIGEQVTRNPVAVSIGTFGERLEIPVATSTIYARITLPGEMSEKRDHAWTVAGDYRVSVVGSVSVSVGDVFTVRGSQTRVTRIYTDSAQVKQDFDVAIER